MRETLAVLRMVSAALKDPVTGVAVQLASLTLLAGDAAPRTPKAILCEADDVVSIRESPVESWPMIVVLEDEQGSDFDAEALVNYREGHVRFVVAVADEASQAVAYQTGAYLREAIVKAITHGLLAEDKIGTAGVLGDVAILEATQLSTGKLKRDPELPPYTAGVRYEVMTRNGNP